MQKYTQNLQTGSLDQSADDSSRCVSAMLNFENENVDVHTLLANGGSPLSVLQSTLKDKLVLDLSGINLSEALYYLHRIREVEMTSKYEVEMISK